MHHSSGQNSKELAIGNDLGRRGSLLVPPHKPHSIGCCDAQSTSATGRCCRKSPRHPTARNNRIIGLDFLNRTCAFETHFESMLLGEPSKIVFRQHRPNADITANAETQPRAIISIERDQCYENRGRWIYQRLQGRTKGIALLLLNAAPIMLCPRLPVIPDWLRGATALMCRDLRGFTGA